MPDRPDLGDIAPERQARRPVDHGADLAGRARDLAHVVAAGHPPGGEAAEGAAADLADRLVAAEVDEGGVAAVGEGLRRCRRRARRRCCGRRPAPDGPRAAPSADSCRRPGRGPRRNRRSPRPSPCPGRAGGRRPEPGRARRAAARAAAGSGCGATPAVQTTVAVGRVSPVESRAVSAVDLLEASSRGGCRCRGRAARAARSRRARRRSRAGPGPWPRPGPSACRAGGRAGSSPSRRRRSPAARRAPRGRRSRRRRRRR